MSSNPFDYHHIQEASSRDSCLAAVFTPSDNWEAATGQRSSIDSDKKAQRLVFSKATEPSDVVFENLEVTLVSNQVVGYDSSR